MHSGGCLCGAVRYSFVGPPIAASLCHCTSCRRATGGPSVAWVVCDETTTEITHGEISLFGSSPGVERGFCRMCGTSLTYRRDSRPGLIDFTTASLDEPDLFAPTKEIWLSERVSWEAANPQLTGHQRSSLVAE